MRIFTWLAVCALALSASGAELHFNFGDYEYGATPTNKFHAELGGGGAAPAWKIISAEIPSAFPSLNSNVTATAHAKVLAQTSEDMTDERYPMFIYDGETFRDFKFTTRFKTVSGIAEQMAGIVFNFQNSSNFYVIRVSTLGNNIGFYKMVNGEIVSPIKLPLTNTNAGWHTLEVDSSGIYVDCQLDGQKALPTITDRSPPVGKLGFWTKSDSISYFANADVDYTPRVAPAQQMVNSVMEKQSLLLGLRIYTLETNASIPRIIASKDQSEIGQTGTEAELQAIQDGITSFGREHGANYVTMPLHDRNGEYIGAVRVKSKSFLGETQDSAVTRATIIRKMVEEYCTTGDELRK